MNLVRMNWTRPPFPPNLRIGDLHKCYSCFLSPYVSQRPSVDVREEVSWVIETPHQSDFNQPVWLDFVSSLFATWEVYDWILTFPQLCRHGDSTNCANWKGLELLTLTQRKRFYVTLGNKCFHRVIKRTDLSVHNVLGTIYDLGFMILVPLPHPVYLSRFVEKRDKVMEFINDSKKFIQEIKL